jgi:hypothetical protein
VHLPIVEQATNLAHHVRADNPDLTEKLELVLTGAQPNAPSPWTVDETGTRWSIQRSDDLGYDPAERAYHFAPFPTLAP